LFINDLVTLPGRLEGSGCKFMHTQQAQKTSAPPFPVAVRRT
jgi:hypothetical protein